MKIIDVSLTNCCNYSCSYCKSGSAPVRQNNVNGVWDLSGCVLDIVPTVQYLNEHFPDYVVQLTGGEPLIVPGVELLIGALNHRQIIVCTNGAPLKRKLRYIHKKVFYRVSYHPEQRTIDDLVECVKDIDHQYLLINYVVHPRHIKSGRASEYIEHLVRSGLPFEVTPFEGIYEGKRVKRYHDLYKGIIMPPDSICDELIIAVIKPNGKVFPCHGVLDDKEPIGDVYGGTFDGGKLCSKRCHVGQTGQSLCPVFESVIRLIQRK